MTKDQAIERYKYADQNRRFEIDLFWKRAAFFWGFLTAAFAAFFLLLKQSAELALIVSAFGLVASFVWLQANRASAFWQKVWEQNLMREEVEVLGRSIYDQVPNESDLGKGEPLIGWKRVSLSGLAAGFSLYTVALWVALAVVPLVIIGRRVWANEGGPAEFGALVFFVLSIVFMWWLGTTCRKHSSIPSKPPTHTKPVTETSPQ